MYTILKYTQRSWILQLLIGTLVSLFGCPEGCSKLGVVNDVAEGGGGVKLCHDYVD